MAAGFSRGGVKESAERLHPEQTWLEWTVATLLATWGPRSISASPAHMYGHAGTPFDCPDESCPVPSGARPTDVCMHAATHVYARVCTNA